MELFFLKSLASHFVPTLQISTRYLQFWQSAGGSEKSTFKELKAPFTYGNAFLIDWHLPTP